MRVILARNSKQRSNLQFKTMALESAIRKAKSKRLMVIAIFDMIMEREEEQVNIKKKRNRINWMRSWIARREERGAFHQLVKELVVEDSAGYRDSFRLNSQQFEFILQKIAKRTLIS